MKLNAHFVACVAALVVAACTPLLGRAQALMMGADGAIHLDDQSGAVGSAPIIINESPEIIQTPGVQPWTGGGQPMMTTPYGMYSPQCVSCAPMMAAPQPNLGPFQRLMKDGGLLWVAGAEFLYARASFSDAVAYGTSDATLQDLNFVPIDFDFEPSYSIYGGAFVSQWGGALIVDFTRLSSEAQFGALTTAINPVRAPVPDADITGAADVDVQTYDLNFSKSLYLGGDSSTPSAGCPTCVAARPAWEPAWELGFEGGMRYADVDWSRSTNGTASGDPTTAVGSFRNQLNFNGFGPRVGVLGRRYIGKRGFLSVYAKGDWSLLWGDVDQSVTRSNVAQAISTTSTSGGDRTIPVTEIELGASGHIGQSASLSAGYFWMAWHDLGMSDPLSLLTLTGGTGANILGFDGLFVRGEVAY